MSDNHCGDSRERVALDLLVTHLDGLKKAKGEYISDLDELCVKFRKCFSAVNDPYTEEHKNVK